MRRIYFSMNEDLWKLNKDDISHAIYQIKFYEAMDK